MNPEPVTAVEALRRLREGNARFVAGTRSVAPLLSQMNREAHAAGQQPFAIILTCSDSRVPTEMIFDQGIGDLFVIRVAGNVVAPSLVGSVEFAAGTFGTQLAVVMGHTSCGAVKATLDVLGGKTDLPSENIRDIVDRIRPSAAAIVDAAGGGDVLAAAVRANVRSSVEHLRRGSRVLENMVRSGKLVVVGAEYDLVSGDVDFFDVPPELAS